MAGIVGIETPTAGVSRSGRIRKKSAKVIEMEEAEKTAETTDKLKTPRTSLGLNNGLTPKKSLLENDITKTLGQKKIKIKIPPIDDNFKDAIMMEGDDEEDQASLDNGDESLLDGLNPYVITPTPALGVLPTTTIIPSTTPLPSITTLTTTPISSKKNERSPKKSTDNNPSGPAVKPIKISRKMVDNESAANKLFEQIASGQPHIDHRRKGFRRNKFKYGIVGNVDFGSDDNDSDEASLVIATDPQDSLASAMAHVNKMKSPKTSEPASEVEEKEEKKPVRRQSKGKLKVTPEGKSPEKKKRGPLVTAYTLFARENRSKIAQSNPHLDFANVSKRLGEVWQTLPNKEKMQWKRKAAKIAQNMHRAAQDPNNASSSKAISSHSKPSLMSKYSSSVTPKYSTKIQDSSLTRKNDGGYVDIACHLKLLGESLNNIGQKLNERPTNAAPASISVLLDSTLCAMGSLIGLTRLVEHSNGCPKEVHDKIMDNVSYIMPGI